MELAAPLTTIPTTLGGAEGHDVAISEEEQQVAGMTSYLYRVYDSAPLPFSVYVGYYEQQTRGKTIHSPKNCLPGSGWEALASALTTVTTPAGPATLNRYLLQNGNRRALVFYWYQGRGRVAADEYRVKWELLRDATLRGRTEEALVRVVVFIPDNSGEEDARQVAERVAADLIPALGQVLPA